MVVREDRKEQILVKAVEIFAELGYYKTTTAMVAKAAGVTQPYVFHFFKSKEELFIAVLQRAFTKIYDTFANTEAPSEQLPDTMGMGFVNMLESHRSEILMLMQSHSIAEPSIREFVRDHFKLIHEIVIQKFEKAGLPEPQAVASQFMATGLLITLSAVLNLPELVFYKPEDYNPYPIE